MIPCLQQSSLEIERNREQRNDHIRQGEVGDEVVCYGLKKMNTIIWGEVKCYK